MENAFYVMLTLIILMLTLVVSQSLLSPPLKNTDLDQPIDQSVPLFKEWVLYSLSVLSVVFIGLVISFVALSLTEIVYNSIFETVEKRVQFP